MNEIVEKELYENIGFQLRTRRNQLGISLDTLVAKIGGVKTKSSLKRYEDGKAKMDMGTLKIICNALNLDYNQVIMSAKTIVIDAPQNKYKELNSILEVNHFSVDEVQELISLANWIVSKRK